MDVERFEFSLLAALTILEPMLIGFCFKQYQLASMGAFGTLGLMYYVYKSDKKLQGLKNVVTFCLVTIGVCAIEVCLNSYFLAIFLIAITSSFLYYWGRVWHWGPGPFFFVMITSMFAGMTNKMSFSSLIIILIYLLIGMIVACINSAIFAFIGPNPKILHLTNKNNKLPQKYPAITYGVIILIALIISGLINGPFSYWITVGCSAVLQAHGYFQTVTRYISYNIGGLIGVALAALLLTLNINNILIIFIITTLMGIVTYFINSHYQFAICFTTPLTIMIVSLNQGNSFNQILKFRLLDVIIGSTIGFIAISLIVIKKRFHQL